MRKLRITGTLPLILLTLAGGTARLLRLDAKFYWTDEAYTSLMVAGSGAAGFNQALTQAAAPGKALELGLVRSLTAPADGRTAADTVRSLWREDPQHAPLYFVMARAWPGSLRLLSAVLSLLLFPALAWLLSEGLGLAGGGAWVTLALAALCPFFLIYAQQAREYSLWTLTLVLLAASFARAERRPSRAAWSGFGALLLGALYADLFTLPVWAGLAAWVLVHRKKGAAPSRGFWVGSAVAIALYLPWLVNLFLKSRQVAADNAWTSAKLPLGPYLGMLWLSTTRLFLDTGVRSFHSLPWREPVFAASQLLVLAAILFALAEGWKRAHPAWKSALACFALPLPAALIASDLLLGGRRALIARYLMPLWLGAVFLAAHGLERAIAGDARRRRWLAVSALGLLLAAGAVSSGMYLRAPTWWTTHPEDLAETAFALRDAPPPRLPVIVIGETNPAFLISLASALDPSWPLRVYAEASPIEDRLKGETFLLYSPSASVLKRLSPTHDEILLAEKRLWRLSPRPPGKPA